MQFLYPLDSRPPAKASILFGIQWFVITLPILVTLGRVTSGLHGHDPTLQNMYLQRLIFIMALALAFQVTLGHRLPLIIGPSTALLMGVLAGRDESPDAIYSAIALGGLFVTFLGLTGCFRIIRRWFTPRVIASVVLLIAVSLAPTVIDLITTPEGGAPWKHMLFIVIMVHVAVLLHGYLKGLWRATVIIWIMIASTALYFLLFPSSPGDISRVGYLSFTFLKPGLGKITFHPGLIISFLFCYLALVVNEIGSIESVMEFSSPADREGRISRGITVAGIAGAISGAFGVIGAVDYSLSPGVISSSRCASRYPLLVTAILFLILSLSPLAIAFFTAIPAAVIGVILAYMICSQLVAGLILLKERAQSLEFEEGLIVATPTIIALIIAFLPAPVFFGIPTITRPVVGNGFVMGLLSALILEHVSPHR